MRSLVSIVEKKTVVRARDLYRSGIHPEALSRALRRGLLLKIGRGLYARKDFSADFERQIMLACKRVPNGIVCLRSAVRFHGLLPLDSASIWMAIDFKAKKRVAGGLKLRFVRFSGQALTQGVENIRIDGVPVRIYSAAKTIADCLKYRKKLGGNLAGKVLRESIARRKGTRHRVTGAQHLIRKHVQKSRNHKNRGDSYCYSRAPNVLCLVVTKVTTVLFARPYGQLSRMNSSIYSAKHCSKLLRDMSRAHTRC
jgi:predicted transcriptional regulator of viral defense system